MPEPILHISAPSLPPFDLLYVEGGDFLMGSDEDSSEQPIHPVTVGSFYMAKYQVTQQLWQAVMGENPSRFKGELRPVENVSWLDAQDFIKKLNGQTGKAFRLPTEAEWEYAAHGSIYTQGYTYAGSDKLKQVGWYDENSGRETHDVGLLLANELGIYDLSGNVLEWCEDDWHNNYDCAPKDGSAWADASQGGGPRVIRGGGCFYRAFRCSPASRGGYAPVTPDSHIGFRLVLPLQSVG